MKVSLTQENLAKALNQILRATIQKPNVPVLANVLIRSDKGKVNFSATNLDISVSTWIGGDIAEEGEVTVNARLLTEFVSQLKDSRVELLQSGQSLEVKSVDNRAQLYIIPAEDFPTLPISEKDPDLVINAMDLKEAIVKTCFAASTDQTRPILTGILLESSQRKAALVGVDGFRLSKKNLKPEKISADELKIVIPAKALLELAKLISDSADAKDTVNIFWLQNKNQVLFKFNEISMTTRVLEGEFPAYQQIIPSEYSVKAKAKAADMAAGIKIASIFARSVIGNKAFFKIDAEHHQLEISANVVDMGNNESKITLAEFEGNDFETAFNAKFLYDMISAVTGEEVIFESNGVSAPGVFRDSDDDSFLHVIMPMRLE